MSDLRDKMDRKGEKEAAAAGGPKREAEARPTPTPQAAVKQLDHAPSIDHDGEMLVIDFGDVAVKMSRGQALMFSDRLRAKAKAN